MFITAMLNFIYTGVIPIPADEDYYRKAMFCIDLYCVVDKYDCPSFDQVVAMDFVRYFDLWTGRQEPNGGDGNLINQVTSCELITQICRLSHAISTCLLVKSLLMIIERKANMIPLGEPEQYRSRVLEVTTVIAEFGRDLPLQTMRKSGERIRHAGTRSETQLLVGNKVSCPHFQKLWLRIHRHLVSRDESEFCSECGKYVEDWSKCGELS